MTPLKDSIVIGVAKSALWYARVCVLNLGRVTLGKIEVDFRVMVVDTCFLENEAQVKD